MVCLFVCFVCLLIIIVRMSLEIVIVVIMMCVSLSIGNTYIERVFPVWMLVIGVTTATCAEWQTNKQTESRAHVFTIAGVVSLNS